MLSSRALHRHRLPGFGHRLLATVVALLFLLPLLWTLAASLHEPGAGARRMIAGIPSPAAWGNYREVFHVVDLL
ncbi:MAG TPA: hypothetical protein VFY70_07325, partial [Thermomicrobiales bacterium]|nr:hypothetical protein [Thermomicrobiales bacterium]